MDVRQDCNWHSDSHDGTPQREFMRNENQPFQGFPARKRPVATYTPGTGGPPGNSVRYTFPL
jgi:hypothetical protein